MPRPTNALIVDDEAHVRMFVRMLLREVGIMDIWEATDGAQALVMVGQHQPELVMLDINLPMMNGLEVLTHLGSEYPGMPVIMVSAQSSMKTVLECVKLGAVAYILKHSSKNEAVRMLREAIETIAAAESDEESA
jgi:two-component system, chemotaxis family, chemotaxis protein CheY